MLKIKRQIASWFRCDNANNYLRNYEELYKTEDVSRFKIICQTLGQVEENFMKHDRKVNSHDDSISDMVLCSLIMPGPDSTNIADTVLRQDDYIFQVLNVSVWPRMWKWQKPSHLEYLISLAIRQVLAKSRTVARPHSHADQLLKSTQLQWIMWNFKQMFFCISNEWHVSH